MMQKSMITTVIALTLFGCGGGEGGSGGGTPAPTVKYYNVSFLGLKVQNNETNCQIFGYNPEGPQEVIAFNSRPDSGYEIILHNPDGSVHKKYNNFSTTSFSFKQNEVPNNGYVSFAEFNSSGISHVTTLAKALLPESLNIYAKGSAANNCLTPSSANPNIQIQEGYINPKRALDYYTGFNTAYQNLDNFTEHYNLTQNGNVKIEFPSQQRPLLAVQYATNEDGSELNQLIGFKFTRFTERGSAATPLELTELPTEVTKAPWTIPNDLTLDSANIFVDGRQFNAPYAYLWQPLTTTQNGSFSYSNEIADTNYYLNIKGKQSLGGQADVWGVQHVAQGTTNKGTSLNADNILVDFPSPEVPRLISCQTDSQKQCLQITSNHLPNNTIQRIFIRAKLNSGDQFVRQVFYTPSQNELPLMEFGSPGIDGQFNDLLSASTSFMQTTQSSIKEAFLYQNQDLFGMIDDFSTQNTNPRVDGIPLLKNIAVQQDFQDKLKRHPYTWVWLKTDNN
ncbi:hypothetical protein [Vibrio paracholerae]|uniref:hypothetical protein n=1 Tax=Vibrio paracholerae TaxID=650003 RepID=UPI000DE51172|nr:hypothetical protein [Vibrio paracholerae]RBM63642.1 hypothetical protein DLR71_06640 [Vibrio paracholerae]